MPLNSSFVASAPEQQAAAGAAVTRAFPDMPYLACQCTASSALRSHGMHMHCKEAACPVATVINLIDGINAYQVDFRHWQRRPQQCMLPHRGVC
jgi:hypothetical protein